MFNNYERQGAAAQVRVTKGSVMDNSGKIFFKILNFEGISPQPLQIPGCNNPWAGNASSS
jgi:hypothetical protein